MKALVLEAAERLVYRDAPDPVPGDGELPVHVSAAGICGSDMHAYLGHDERRPVPLILGHECAGVITGGRRDGERVAINPLVTCSACNACRGGRENLCPDRQIVSMPPREGAFAEWVAIPERNLVTVPDDVPLERAALAEPIACGWHAARLSGAAAAGVVERALILGGGAIGLGAALSLAVQGIGDVMMVEPNAARRAALEAAGQRVMDTDALGPDEGFDLVIDGAGYSATRATASRHVRPGGAIAHIGLAEAAGGLDIRRMTLWEITFIGTYTYTAEDFRQTAAAIFDGRLGPLDWAETRPMSAGAEAFADIRAGRVAAPKIILDPSQ